MLKSGRSSRDTFCLIFSLIRMILCNGRLSDPAQYQSIVDAEWNIIYDKLDKCVQSGVEIVLSRLAIGDLATQVCSFLLPFLERISPNSNFQWPSLIEG